MNSSKYSFTLDLHTSQSQVSIPAAVGDSNRSLHISLSDGGQPYFIADGSLASLLIKRPTGSHFEISCQIENNATIKYNFSQNEHTCAVAGIHECQIILTDLEGECIASPRFTMVVSDKVVNEDDYVISDEDQIFIQEVREKEAERRNNEDERQEHEVLRQELYESVKKIPFRPGAANEDGTSRKNVSGGNPNANIVTGIQGFSWGNGNTSSNARCVTFGDQCKATNWNAFAGGQKSESHGANNFAYGYSCINQFNDVLGDKLSQGNTAIGYACGTNGFACTAIGQENFAGADGEVNGVRAISGGVAIGHTSRARHNFATCIGHGLKSGDVSQTTLGVYNIPVANAALVIGNGKSDNERSNAGVMYKDGIFRLHKIHPYMKGNTATYIVGNTDGIGVDGADCFLQFRNVDGHTYIHPSSNGEQSFGMDQYRIKHVWTNGLTLNNLDLSGAFVANDDGTLTSTVKTATKADNGIYFIDLKSGEFGRALSCASEGKIGKKGETWDESVQALAKLLKGFVKGIVNSNGQSMAIRSGAVFDNRTYTHTWLNSESSIKAYSVIPVTYGYAAGDYEEGMDMPWLDSVWVEFFTASTEIEATHDHHVFKITCTSPDFYVYQYTLDRGEKDSIVEGVGSIEMEES